MRSLAIPLHLAFFAAALVAGWLLPGAPWEAVRALVLVPALLILPGLGWARGVAHPLDRVMRGVGISLIVGVPLLVFFRYDSELALLVAGTVCLEGWRRPSPGATPLLAGEKAGIAAVVLATLLVACSWWSLIKLPLDGNWWSPAAEELPDEGQITLGSGWTQVERIGGAVVASTEEGSGEFELDEGIVALRGPVGAVLQVGDQSAVIETDPVQDPEEGPVPRYLKAGVVSLRVHEGGTIRVPPGLDVVIMADQAGIWELHEANVLRFGHYYQLLNMVEQLRWAREMGDTRWVTDVQPPLWSWPLGVAVVFNDGEQPTANVLFLYVCLLLGLAGVRVVGRWAPDAPWIAWCLPAFALAEHAKLMLVAGSAGLPDSAYTLAVVGLLGSAAGAGWGIVAQLARYPGTLIAGLFLVFAGRRAEAMKLGVGVAALILAFGLGGWATGDLDGWIETAMWETGPEHWHGETSPSVLLARIPAFYLLWLGYAGGTPLLIPSVQNRAVNVLYGTALAYSLLLCTIDHSPSHYFLPLVWLSVLAVAVGKPRKWAWPAWLAAVGMGYALWGVPITG